MWNVLWAQYLLLELGVVPVWLIMQFMRRQLLGRERQPVPLQTLLQSALVIVSYAGCCIESKYIYSSITFIWTNTQHQNEGWRFALDVCNIVLFLPSMPARQKWGNISNVLLSVLCVFYSFNFSVLEISNSYICSDWADIPAVCPRFVIDFRKIKGSISRLSKK